MRFTTAIAALFLALAAAAPALGQPASSVAIDWDDRGVPHIAGGSLEAAGYGVGWAQMEARGQTIAGSYLVARGEAAACLGESAFRGDLRVRQLGVPERAVVWLAAQDAESAALNRGLVSGMNAWLTAHPGQGGALACLGAVRDTDPLAMLQVILHVGVVAFGADEQLGDWRETRGSNAYAVAPSRTADGRPLLLINPHSTWAAPYLVFELQVTAPGLDAYGMTYPGLPLPVMGFSRDHGWALTFNDIDGADLYELALAPGGYVLGGETFAFKARTRTIQVKLASGAMESRVVTLQESLQGPVLETLGDHAVAARIAGLDRPGLTSQLLAMWRADSLASFKAALGQQQLPITNVVYADARGDILYLFNGLSPRRAGGDRAFWAGIVDGTDPALIWTGYDALEDLPQTTNPANGLLQNANDGPTSSSWPPAIELSKLDPLLTDDRRTPRGRRSLRQLTEAPPLTLDGIGALRASSVMDLAELVRGPLAQAALASGDLELVGLGRVLAGWDGSAGADSRGSVLFADWAYRMRRAGLATVGVDLQTLSPLSTTAALADPAKALETLRAAAVGLKTRFGRADLAWGEVYRIRRAGLDLPSPVGRDELGAFNAGHYDRVAGKGPEAGTFTLVSASTFVAEVAFGPDGPRARGLLTYGNADDDTAPGVREQLTDFSQGRVRPIAFSPAEVAAASRRREVLEAKLVPAP